LSHALHRNLTPVHPIGSSSGTLELAKQCLTRIEFFEKYHLQPLMPGAIILLGKAIFNPDSPKIKPETFSCVYTHAVPLCGDFSGSGP
jgi:hypothetical protein